MGTPAIVIVPPRASACWHVLRSRWPPHVARTGAVVGDPLGDVAVDAHEAAPAGGVGVVGDVGQRFGSTAKRWSPISSGTGLAVNPSRRAVGS